MRTEDLAARMGAILRETFAPQIPRGARVALVGLPTPLDSSHAATWLGEKTLLSELGAEIVYECSAQSYDRDAMAAKLGDGVILVHGEAQARFAGDFPKQRIVALSQPAAPDAAFLLGLQTRTVEPVFETVWIGRTDAMRAGDQTESAARLSSQSAEKFELPPFDDGIEMHFAVKQRPPTVLLTDWTSMFFENVQNRNAMKLLDLDAQARIHATRAMYMLSLGHVVITDRLRAHILCLLLGIPHVLLNDKAGTNWNFHQRWTQASPLVRVAAAPADAWTLARAALPRIKELENPRDWSWQD